ncbi:hypothetical protein H6G93_39140 [Nostoc sp. FACHB-973]|nr:hypothetical protein [Nostoc sp. FACHB-973]
MSQQNRGDRVLLLSKHKPPVTLCSHSALDRDGSLKAVSRYPCHQNTLELPYVMSYRVYLQLLCFVQL